MPVSDSFPLAKWDDVLTIRNGKNQKAVECPAGSYPICGSGGEMGRASAYITRGDSVIIGRKGNINNPILMREPFWNVDTAFGLEPNEGRLTVEYLYYFCEWFNFEKLNKAVTIPSLTKADLLKLDMPLPPLAFQRRFTDRIGLLDRLKSILVDIEGKLDDLVKSGFVEMFGDPIVGDRNYPLANWEDVLAIRNGKNQKAVECPDGRYPICGSGGEMGRASSYITKGGSVIIGRKGNINRPILMREPFWNVDTAFGLEPKESVLTVEYLFAFCEWFDFEKLNKAVTIPSLTKADLLRIRMPLPSFADQLQFADFVAKVDKLGFKAQAILELVKSLVGYARGTSLHAQSQTVCLDRRHTVS